ncbi:DUF1127 domain-containing protein [Fodinicurvata halophila]|uniref:DUF1127 domain-containing protein n=1 Tax=Fodinicurvata halophila TaxID=1419723 RepID=A0ABV8UI04_9PROT
MAILETTGLLAHNSPHPARGVRHPALSFWERLAAFAQARERARRHRKARAELAALDARLLCDIGCPYLERRDDRAPRYRPLAAPVLHIRAE